MENPKLQEIINTLAKLRDVITNAKKAEIHTQDAEAFPLINLDRIVQGSDIFEYYKQYSLELLDDLIAYLQNPIIDPIRGEALLTDTEINEMEQVIREQGLYFQPTFIDFKGWTDSLSTFKIGKRIDLNPSVQKSVIEPFFRFEILNLGEMNKIIGLNWSKEEWYRLFNIFCYNPDSAPGDFSDIKPKYLAFLSSKGLDADFDFRGKLFDTMLLSTNQMKLVASELTADYGGDMFINIINAYYTRFMLSEY